MKEGSSSKEQAKENVNYQSIKNSKIGNKIGTSWTKKVITSHFDGIDSFKKLDSKINIRR